MADHVPTPRQANRTALLFLVCFVFAQADKQVLGLLAVPVQDAFKLSNSELGLLQGVAFALAYAIGGLPIARLLDGCHRVRIAAACVAFWSLATILCGLAGSFLALALCRAATAAAEAGLPPAAFSIFGQNDDKRLTAKMTNTFMLAPFIGGGLMLLLGGVLLKLAADGDVAIPGFAEPWRVVFAAVGIPGLLLAPMLLWFAHEPPRPPRRADGPHLPSFGAVIAAIFVNSRFLGHYFIGLTTFMVLLFAVIAWYPAVLIRDLGVAPAAAGGYAGITYLIAGVLGTLGARWLAGVRKDLSIGAMIRSFLVAVLLLVPVAVGMALVGDLVASLALYAVYAFLSAGIFASMAIPIQLSLDNSMIARGIAIFSLLTSALAGSAGPLIVGLLTDYAALSLAQALAVTGATATAMASVLLHFAARGAGEPEILRERTA